MEPNHFFKVKQKLFIALVGEDEFYVTSIQDINRHIIYVAIPTKEGKVLIAKTGIKVEIQLIADDALFSFRTKVLGVKSGDQIPLLMLQRPVRVTRKQRREYYRCPLLLDMDICIYSKNKGAGDIKQQEENWKLAKVLDLSGGGLRFSASESLSKGDMVKMKIKLTDKEQSIITATGSVIQIYASDAALNSRIYGVGFTEIKENHREQLINYIFTITRKRLL